ncbi:transposase [Arsenophonus endosymbiont of Bemisia tabaci]|uniref:transposase n=1 Tax=Arsenophonus endosymbiont of Bemisia tabaci TaxID=536059 RepID=UPI0021037002
MDESGFSHDTPRTHGYSPKGQRCLGFKNWGAKGRTNVIGALFGTTLFAIGLCLLSDYLISILTAMFSMHESPKSLS